MEKRKNTGAEQQQKGQQQGATDAQRTTPLSERISETGMDQLEEKTERFTHTEESENREGTPWSPGQASS